VKQRTYPYLDLIRGLAALAVFFGHARSLFFVDYQPGSGLLARLFYFSTGFGHQSVMVFFVLSGFFISRAIHTRWAANTWNWRDYLVSRLSRLWVVLLPALVLTCLWDFVGSRFGMDRSIYLGTALAKINLGRVADSVSVPIFLGNVFFLQTILVPVFGSDVPLWSLANEFWYYLIYPCLVCSWKRTSTKPMAALWFVAAAGMLVFVGWGISLGFVIWLGGVLAYGISQVLIHREYRFSKVWMLGSLVLLGASLTLTRAARVTNNQADFLVGGGTIPLVTILATNVYGCRPWLARVAARLADMSYSLYAVHLPLLICLSAFLVGNQRWNLSLHTDVNWFFVCAVTFAYAYGVYWLFESRTDRFRKAIFTQVR
jgi:peptidoglycan/LPS O-acetylase OafA/YrhL